MPTMMSDLKRKDDLLIRPKVIDTNQDHPATIDYRLILAFLVVAAFLFRF